MNEKQKQQIAVMDWAEARLNDGWLVDVVWRLSPKLRCIARMEEWGGGEGGWLYKERPTELAARLALKEAWEARYGKPPAESEPHTLSVDEKFSAIIQYVQALNSKVNRLVEQS